MLTFKEMELSGIRLYREKGVKCHPDEARPRAYCGKKGNEWAERSAKKEKRWLEGKLVL